MPPMQGRYSFDQNCSSSFLLIADITRAASTLIGLATYSAMPVKCTRLTSTKNPPLAIDASDQINTNDLEQFAERLRRWRRDRGITFRDLGRQVGVSAGFLCNLERRRALPSLPTLCALSQLMGYDQPSIEPSMRTAPTRIVRRDASASRFVGWERLAQLPPSPAEFLRVRLSGRTAMTAADVGITPGDSLFVFVVCGRVKIRNGNDERVIGAGQSVFCRVCAPLRVCGGAPQESESVWFVFRSQSKRVYQQS